ncbi:hypothetical protein FEM48_Zijuj04G0142900 [Ziziphus jujuba var. spinosa]|uniref:Transcriptional adapter n=1 Tax=Ziziphus jujuba var. spinosa TaxID=714518 RepID=A0A978VKD0_ZIZJJ|nr:hypothetical protein FEM48_Zijuj04G0142900 [Ziziphus jujuba var. spinosa]
MYPGNDTSFNMDGPDNLAYPLICPDWNADEGSLLLEGIEMYGFRNWSEVAEHVGTKSKAQCINHYNATICMNSPFFPLLDLSHVMKKSREELLAMAKELKEVFSFSPFFSFFFFLPLFWCRSSNAWGGYSGRGVPPSQRESSVYIYIYIHHFMYSWFECSCLILFIYFFFLGCSNPIRYDESRKGPIPQSSALLTSGTETNILETMFPHGDFCLYILYVSCTTDKACILLKSKVVTGSVLGAVKKTSNKIQINDEANAEGGQEYWREKARLSGEKPFMMELSGYNSKRQEFKIEYDNDAEQLLADMEFKDSDTNTERELKLQVLHIYSKRLDERKYRKDFISERNLLYPDPFEKNLSPEEKDMQLQIRFSCGIDLSKGYKIFRFIEQKRKRETRENALRIKESSQAGPSGKGAKSPIMSMVKHNGPQGLARSNNFAARSEFYLDIISTCSRSYPEMLWKGNPT